MTFEVPNPTTSRFMICSGLEFQLGGCAEGANGWQGGNPPSKSRSRVLDNLGQKPGLSRRNLDPTTLYAREKDGKINSSG
jgi:hypothetical protein